MPKVENAGEIGGSLAFDILTDVRAELGESPFWCPHEQCIWWVDIEGRRVLRTRPDGATEQWPTPEMAGFVVLTAPGRPAVGMETGIFALDPASGHFERLVAHKPAGLRFNDATVDASGRLWAATMRFTPDRPDGRLYVIGADRVAHPTQDGLFIANGLAFDADRGRLYLSDSIASVQTVWRFPCDAASGALGPREVFADFNPLAGRPDGAALDAHGNYWIAGVGGGQCLHVFSPDGHLLHTIPTPAANPTKPAFGGPDFDRLYLTSKGGGGSDGALAVARSGPSLPFRGRPLPYWTIA